MTGTGGGSPREPLRKLYLELTTGCNLDCSICYRQSWNEQPCDMSAGLFRMIREQIPGMADLKSIVLGGIGEPTSAPLFAEAVSALRDYDLTVTTNGVAIGPTELQAMTRWVNLIMISIDGLHDRYAEIRGADLEGVIATIREIQAERKRLGNETPQIGIQFVLTKENADDLFRLIDLADRLDIGNITVSNLLPQTGENAGLISYTRYENRETRILFGRVQGHAMRRGVTVALPVYELRTDRQCSFVDDGSTFIGATGDVLPCYRLSHTCSEYVFGREKTVLRHSFGRLQERPLQEIWESEEYVSFRRTVTGNRYPSCIDCDLADGCNLIDDTAADCHTNAPSCADCLWARRFVVCP